MAKPAVVQFLVVIVYRQGLRKLRISLQSLAADDVPGERIRVVVAGRRDSPRKIADRYGASLATTAEFLSEDVFRSNAAGWCFLRAGDVWLPGKRAAVEKWLVDSDTDAFSHDYFPAVPEGRRAVLSIERRSRAPSPCPLSCWSERTRKMDSSGIAARLEGSVVEARGFSVFHSPEPLAAVWGENRMERFKRWCSIGSRTTKAGERRLGDFAGWQRGRRAFVIGNGPSLKGTDLSKLAGELTFVSNGFFHYFDRIAWRPSVYSCIDSVVLPSLAGDLVKVTNECPETRFFFPSSIEDDDLFAVRWWTRSLVSPAPNVAFFDESEGPETGAAGYGRGIGRHLVRPATVTLTLLQLAVLMGCEPIYLIGCDNAYSIPENAILTRAARPGAVTRIVLPDDSDPNHFDPSYFGTGKPWHIPNTEKMTWDYRRFRAEVDPAGRRIFNATTGGLLEEFPRVSFDSLF